MLFIYKQWETAEGVTSARCVEFGEWSPGDSDLWWREGETQGPDS